MILVRGIKEEKYARRIEDGFVDCRDVLSTLLEPPVTGYEYSDYYEKNLVKAISSLNMQPYSGIHDPRLVYNLLIDYFIPHIYLTYFHIMNENSLEWLNKFDDDYHFISVNVKIDRNTRTAIGDGFFGSKMKYVDDISELDQDGYKPFHVACMCSLEKNYKKIDNMLMPLSIYNTLAFSLLCREKDKKFTEFENEFRFITYDCPRMENDRYVQENRKVTILGKSGIEYKGTLKARENTSFEHVKCVFSKPTILLSDIVKKENGKIILDSKFKSIDIASISDDYKYIGDKKQCETYIRNMLSRKQVDKYVRRTVKTKLNVNELTDVMFYDGYYKVNY